MVGPPARRRRAAASVSEIFCLRRLSDATVELPLHAHTHRPTANPSCPMTHAEQRVHTALMSCEPPQTPLRSAYPGFVPRTPTPTADPPSSSSRFPHWPSPALLPPALPSCPPSPFSMSLLPEREWTRMRQEPHVGQELRLRQYNLRIVDLLSSWHQCRENQLKVFEVLNTENGERYVLKVTQPIHLSLKEVDRLTEVRKWVRFTSTPGVPDDSIPCARQIYEVEKSASGLATPPASLPGDGPDCAMTDTAAVVVAAPPNSPAPLLVQRMWMQEALIQRFLAQRYSSAGQTPVAPAVRESRWLKMSRKVQDSGSFRQSLFVLMDKVPGLAVLEFVAAQTRAGQPCSSWLPPVLEQCIAAVARIHGAGVVHGDLRSAHLFVVEPLSKADAAGTAAARHVMIIDYGLSRFAKLEENLYLDRMQSGLGSFYLSSMDPSTGMPTASTDWISLCGVFREVLSHCLRYARAGPEGGGTASGCLRAAYQAVDDLFMSCSHDAGLATAAHLRSLLAKHMSASSK